MEVSHNPDLNQTNAYTADTAILEGVIVVPGAALGSCAIAGANPGVLLGVNFYDTASGANCDVVQGGIARVKTGGIVTRGQHVTSDNSGRAITATLAAAGATYIVELGIALETSGGANEYIAVMLTLAPVIIA